MKIYKVSSGEPPQAIVRGYYIAQTFYALYNLKNYFNAFLKILM